jgi:hypothetical protein
MRCGGNSARCRHAGLTMAPNACAPACARRAAAPRRNSGSRRDTGARQAASAARAQQGAPRLHQLMLAPCVDGAVLRRRRHTRRGIACRLCTDWRRRRRRRGFQRHMPAEQAAGRAARRRGGANTRRCPPAARWRRGGGGHCSGSVGKAAPRLRLWQCCRCRRDTPLSRQRHRRTAVTTMSARYRAVLRGPSRRHCRPAMGHAGEKQRRGRMQTPPRAVLQCTVGDGQRCAAAAARAP